MDVERSRSATDDGAWRFREGTPLRSLPGFTVEATPGGVRPSLYLTQPQLEQEPWYRRQDDDRAYDVESARVSDDADSISSSTGGLFKTISIPVPCQQPAKKTSLSPTPSFTYIDDKAAAAARKQAVSCCASKSVLKITVTFCVSFLLGMALTVIYMEVYLWRRR